MSSRPGCPLRAPSPCARRSELGSQRWRFAVFVAPQLLSLLVEAPLLVWAERRARHWVLALGLAGMALSLWSSALAPHALFLGMALALYAPASGVACGIAQAALMDADPERREQRMADWALAGTLGDLASPLLLWVARSAGLGWRAAFAVAGSLLVVEALVIVRRPLPNQPRSSSHRHSTETDDSRGRTDLRRALATVVRNRTLLLWLIGVGLCSFMDEVLGALAGLRIHAATGSTGQVALALVAFTLGGALGLLLLRRLLLRVAPTRLLLLASIGCMASYVAWLLVEPTWYSAGMMLLAGACAAAHYPIAQAQAYRTLPGRSLVVAAAGQLVIGFDLALPLALGWITDRIGLMVALWMLVGQPLGLVMVAVAARHRSCSR